MQRFFRVSEMLARTAVLAVLSAGGVATAAPADVPPLPEEPVTTSRIVTTLLGEVGRGAIDGREFLTLQIARQVGPPGCRGDVLRVDPVELGSAERRQRIETAALSALLGDRAVSVTVPLDAAGCVDGKPTFTDVRPLPPSL